MAATAERADSGQTLYKFLHKRALEGELNRWGQWIEERSDYQGYPRVNVLMGFLMGRGGGGGGHRILCLDMPAEVYSTHAKVLSLNEEMQEAVWVYYVTRIRPDGRLWTLKERATALKITEEALRMRVSRARKVLLGG